MADSGSASCQAVSQVERSRGTTSRAITDAGGVGHGDDLVFRYVMSSIKCATSDGTVRQKDLRVPPDSQHLIH